MKKPAEMLENVEPEIEDSKILCEITIHHGDNYEHTRQFRGHGRRGASLAGGKLRAFIRSLRKQKTPYKYCFGGDMESAWITYVSRYAVANRPRRNYFSFNGL